MCISQGEYKLANKILLKEGTAIVVADATDYPNVAAANSLGARTKQIDLTSLVAGAARQSEKLDFGVGDTTWARRFAMTSAIEMDTPPVAGEQINFYLAFSHSGTAANANPGGVSGSDSAYSGYSGNLDDSLKQLVLIGSMTLTVQDSGTVQIELIGVFIPVERYASLVVVNSTAADDFEGDANEMSIRIAPITDEIQ